MYYKLTSLKKWTRKTIKFKRERNRATITSETNKKSFAKENNNIVPLSHAVLLLCNANKKQKEMWHTHRYKTTHTHDRSNPRRMLAQLGHTPIFETPLLAATPPPGPASDARTFWCWNRRGGRVPPGVADVRFGLCSGRARAHQPLYKVTSLFWLVWRERWSSGPEAFGVFRVACGNVLSARKWNRNCYPRHQQGKHIKRNGLKHQHWPPDTRLPTNILRNTNISNQKQKKKNTLFCCEEALIRS